MTTLQRILYNTIGILLPVFASVTAEAQLTEKNYRIYSTSLQKEVSINDIADAMEENDVLFFGEEHNDSVTHFLENKIFETLFSKYGTQVALSLEMFDRDVQTVMNEYLDGHIREKNFKKDARVWSNYADYRPMIEFAKTNNLDVICANAPSRYTNLAGRKGQEALRNLSDEAKNYFAPLPYDTASGGYYEKLMGLSSHDPGPSKDTAIKKAPLPAMAMGGFSLIVAQSLWDATMAYSIYEYLQVHRRQKIMQVNGRFHSDDRFAVVTQLENYRPQTKSLVISSGSDEAFPNIQWEQYKHLGDYIIITDPQVPKTYKE
ncbi:MAG: ChaN family lipoprotein [Bacteroidetes bacterium]|nr:ChaN family lipoprotein [Bacteroidota bacterium]MBP6315035.1 ChaN family lipoprotein [Chitinophagaceae bacterium]